MKFTPYGGEIVVSAKLVKKAEELSVDDADLQKIVMFSAGATYLEMQIQDTGLGISQEDIPKLFQLFGFLDSTKQLNTKGIGLGLHITKKITKMFDGDIVCRSELGHGATFTLIVAIERHDSSS